MFNDPADPERHELTAPNTSGSWSVDLPLVGIPSLDVPPSNGSARVQAGSNVEVDDETEAARATFPSKAFPLYDNLYVVVPGRDQLDEEEDKALLESTDRDNVDPFDLPERDRMYALAAQFVANHVRVVRSGEKIKSAAGKVFQDGTLVISEDQFPRFPLRLAKITWAIEGGRVVDVRGHRVLCAHLSKVAIPPRRFIWAPGRGDSFDLAYLLANLCAILNLHIPVPVAAIGDIGLQVNQIFGDKWLVEERREAIRDGQIRDLILPLRSGFMPGDHRGVYYWLVQDINEAFFSLLAAASSETAIPDLKRRWRVKMTFSWISLVSVLAAFSVSQLDTGYLGQKGFESILSGAALRWSGAVTLGLVVICVYTTHKYNRMDR
jgi:hypothetical protein